MTANWHIFTNSLLACIYKFIACKLHNSLFIPSLKKKIAQMLPKCHSMRCKILCTAWQIIVYAHEFFEEKSPFVQANYRSICCEISLELSSKLSSKSRGNKEQNLRI